MTLAANGIKAYKFESLRPTPELSFAVRELGCVAGAGLDYVQLGIQTGKMAAQILTGEATCEDLPYETIENYGLYVNSNALAAMGLTLPEDVAQNAEEVGPTA